MTNSVPLDLSGSWAFSIPELMQLAEEGNIRIPTFQRDFSWRAGDVRKLFDSIYRGFPIGTLLLWRKDAPAEQVKLGPISFDAPRRSDAYWVVDGQQRITSLFAALSRDHGQVDDPFNVYFDLEKQQFANARRGKMPFRAIPVKEALETRTLLQWLRMHADELEPEDLDLADRLGGALRDYRIPAYIVAGNDPELLREVFDRMNSAGKPISRAQVFHALFAAEDEPGSPAQIVEALRKKGFGNIDEGRVVQSLLAIRGGDVQRDIRAEFSNSDEPSDWFYNVEIALGRAIDFLREEGVPHQLLMPNTFPLPVLAAFLHLHPHPDPWNKRLLARWLWRGWVHGFGREGGQTPVLRRSIRNVNPEFRVPEAAPSEYEAVSALLEHAPDRAAPELPLDGFNTKNANSRLILLALTSLRPLDENGNEIELARQLETYGTDAVTQLVPGHRSLAAARSFWPVDSTSISVVTRPDILASHLMDDELGRILVRGDADLFIERRHELLRERVAAFLDSRLEADRRPRPPLSELMIDEPAERT